MKKIIICLLVILLAVGCTPPEKNNLSGGMSQQEFFEFLYNDGTYDNGDTGYYISFFNDETIGIGQFPGSYYRKGSLKDFKYEGENVYSMTIAVPAFEGNELTDPYEAYDYALKVTVDPAKKEEIKAESNEFNNTFVYYVAPKGLSQEEFFAKYSKPDSFVDNDGNYVSFINGGIITLTKAATSYFRKGYVYYFSYLGDDVYNIKIHIDGFEGNEMIDPYPAYEYTMTVTVYPDDENKLHIATADYDADFTAVYPLEDNGLTMKQFFDYLDDAKQYNGPNGYFLKFISDDVVRFGLNSSGYLQQGHISGFKYLGSNVYEFSVEVPAFEGNEMTDPYDAYSYPLKVTLQTDITHILAESNEFNGEFIAEEESASASDMTVQQFFDYLKTRGRYFGSDGFFLDFYSDQRIQYGIYATSYGRIGYVQDFTKEAENTYSMILSIDGSPGNEMYEGYEAYYYPIRVTIDPSTDGVIYAESTEFSEVMMAHPYEETLSYPLSEGEEKVMVDSHFTLAFHGKGIGGGMYEYTMTMYRDDKSVPSGIFDDPNNRVIYSNNMAADFKWTRIYDFLILDSSIAKNNTMHYVVIFNIRTNQIEAEFKDVEFSTKFEYLSDHFEMKIGNDTYFINGSKLVKG